MCNVVKKMSAILMSVLICSTSAMSGYAAERFENTGLDEVRGVLKPSRMMLAMRKMILMEMNKWRQCQKLEHQRMPHQPMPY